MLDGISSVELGYFDRDPESGQVRLLSSWEDDTRVPVGIEIVITLDDAAVYRRVLELAGGEA